MTQAHDSRRTVSVSWAAWRALKQRALAEGVTVTALVDRLALGEPAGGVEAPIARVVTGPAVVHVTTTAPVQATAGVPVRVVGEDF